jgi:hypothetical protein
MLPSERRCCAVDDRGNVCGQPVPPGASLICWRHRTARTLEQRLSDATFGISPAMREAIDRATYRAAVDAERAFRRAAEGGDV